MRLYLLTFTAMFIILTGCSSDEPTTASDAPTQDKEVKTAEVENESVSASSENVKTEPELERTEPLPDGEVPWEAYELFGSDDAIQERAQKGEVVFLLDDAEALEKDLTDFAYGNSDKPAEWWHTVVLYYNGTLAKKYPDKAEYFAKMKEVEDALMANSLDNIPKLINEAKTLR